MTIRGRLFLSNQMMIVVPIVSAAAVALLSLFVIMMVMQHGTSYGLDGEGSFVFASQGAVELIESGIETGNPMPSPALTRALSRERGEWLYESLVPEDPLLHCYRHRDRSIDAASGSGAVINVRDKLMEILLRRERGADPSCR